jgi:hypothetical protein
MGHNSVGREEAVRRLRNYAKVGLGAAEGNFGDALNNETDRGAVILLASAIEDVLENRLKREMVKLSADEADRLFGTEAPLGSLSAKTKLAYALGIIDRDAVRMIDLLRDMRNACGHSRQELSFETPVLRDVAKVLLTFLSDDEINPKHGMVMRLYVSWVAGWLTRYVSTGSRKEADAVVQEMIRHAQREAAEEKAEHAASLKRRRERDAQRRQES